MSAQIGSRTLGDHSAYWDCRRWGIPPGCSLLTIAQVTELLGAAPQSPAGNPDDHGNNYKTRAWNTSDSANYIDVAVFVSQPH